MLAAVPASANPPVVCVGGVVMGAVPVLEPPVCTVGFFGPVGVAGLVGALSSSPLSWVPRGQSLVGPPVQATLAQSNDNRAGKDKRTWRELRSFGTGLQESAQVSPVWGAPGYGATVRSHKMPGFYASDRTSKGAPCGFTGSLNQG